MLLLLLLLLSKKNMLFSRALFQLHSSLLQTVRPVSTSQKYSRPFLSIALFHPIGGGLGAEGGDGTFGFFASTGTSFAPLVLLLVLSSPFFLTGGALPSSSLIGLKAPPGGGGGERGARSVQVARRVFLCS